MADGTQVGTAYVEVTTKLDPGAKEKIRRQLPDESDGGRSGRGLANGMKAGLQAGAVALGNIISNVATSAASKLSDTFVQAFDGFAAYEQLSGGVEKLFDAKAAKTVQENAEKAFKTAGMSANDYMEQVTSFSASLIGSLEGDTQTAANYADIAMRDMSDNANTFGTDMASIQNAYQGFAKGNFTMLDNLKLGYGGTKTEMERLLRDAEQMDGLIEGSLSVDNFADIVGAIDTIQEHMNISGLTAEQAAEMVASGALTEEEAFKRMGTTAREGQTTVEGSINSMKAAWDNWLVALGRDDVDLGVKTDELVQSIETAASNALPVVGRIMQSFGMTILENAPLLYDNAMIAFSQIAVAVPDAAPQAIAAIVALAMQIGGTLAADAPYILSGAFQMFAGILSALFQAIPGIIAGIGIAVPQFCESLASEAPNMLESAKTLFNSIGRALGEVVPMLVEAIVYVVTHLPDIVAGGVGAMFEAGQSFFGGIIDGFTGKQPEVEEAASGTADAAVQAALESADATPVSEKMGETMLSGFDFSQFSTATESATQDAIDAATQNADAAPVSEKISTTASTAVDMNAMDVNAAKMVENAVKAAQSVDSSTVGQQFSEQAAGGIDTKAMADKVAAATAAANTNVKVDVQVDTSGIQKLTSMAGAMASSYVSASSRASTAVKGISAAAVSSTSGFSTMSSKAVASLGQVATKAASVKQAIDNIPSSKTVTITTAKGHLWYPTYSMPAIKPGETRSASVSWNYMAEGGILTKPVFVAGEAGPEAVLPLSKLAGMLDESNKKYGGDVVVNLNYDASADAEEMARDIARSLKRYRMAGAF